jgi:Viral BACON domain/Putative binding domain, N-terminal
MLLMRDVCVRRTMIRSVLAATLTFLPAVASAQAIVDGRTLEFTPSPDHNVVASDGTPLVTSYTLQIFTIGGTQIVQSVNLGKPTPQSDGAIRVDFVALLSTPLTPGVQYEARVAAVGPGGQGVSSPSNAFSFSPVCAPALSAVSVSLPAAASTGSVGVVVAAGCTWSASSPAAWLTVTSGSTGSGNGTVTVTVDANTGSAQRTGTATIAGRTLVVTQMGGAACTYTVIPATITAPASGTTGTITVTTATGCSWSTFGTPAWMTIANGSETGSGTVTYTVAANSGTTSRSATLLIGGRSVVISQAAATSPAAPSSPSNLRLLGGGQ